MKLEKLPNNTILTTKIYLKSTKVPTYDVNKGKQVINKWSNSDGDENEESMANIVVITISILGVFSLLRCIYVIKKKTYKN